MVKRHNHNNVITARSTTTQDIFSSNHSSQSISNQSTLQRKSDSARHHSRSTSNIESVSDVVREDTIDKVIKKSSVKDHVKSNWKSVTTNHQYHCDTLMHIGHSSTEYSNSDQTIRTKKGFQNKHSGYVRATIDGTKKLIDDSKLITGSIRDIKHSIYQADNIPDQGAQIFSNINQITDLKVEVTTGMSNKISLVESISITSKTIA